MTTLDDRERVKATVGHLVRRKQQEIERAVRLLRTHFVNWRPRSPRRGTLYRLMLVGAFAGRDGPPDRETGEINEYEIWAFVDYPEYRGRNRHWGVAQRAVASSLRGRARITLSVFTLDEMDRVRAAGNRFLTNLYNGAITVWERAEQDVPND
ncbi:MAG: hypothetical protein ACTHJK_11515 [Sphingomicrobium sp.]